jgi:hypothetical protein
MMRHLSRRARAALVVLPAALAAMLAAAGCAMPSLPAMPGLGADGVRVRVTSVPVKIVFAATSAAVEVAADEYLGMTLDMPDLLKQIFGVESGSRADARVGVPPAEAPVLMVVNEHTNDVLYWTLADEVKAIRLKHNAPGEIELKVVNDDPLRVELWIGGDVEAIDAVIEFRE